MTTFDQIRDMAMIYFRNNPIRDNKTMDKAIKEISRICDYSLSFDEIEKIKNSISNMA